MIFDFPETHMCSIDCSYTILKTKYKKTLVVNELPNGLYNETGKKNIFNH
jgi:hypothetical protein